MEVPRLIDHIDPSLRHEVLRSFPPEYLRRYEIGMHAIKRLGHAPYLPIRPGFEESDLEHTCGMLDMLQELRGRSPLRKAFNYRQTTYMIAMHDAGELIVGDGPPFGEERESPKWRRRKQLEPKVALRRVVSQIPDPEVQAEMTSFYHRFSEQGTHDREALLTRYLDKAQGTTRTGPSSAFGYRALGYSKPSYELLDHVQNTTSIFLGAALNFIAALPPSAAEDMKVHVISELERFKSIGFERLADEKITQFRRATSTFKLKA